MKTRRLFLLSCLFLSGIVFITSGCSKKSDSSGSSNPGTTGSIKGKAVLPPGVSGDLRNATACLYNNVPVNGVHNPDRTVGVTGSKDSVNFTFSGLAAGDYFIDVWKDSVPGGNTWQRGDIVGWYGSGEFDNPLYIPVNVNTAITSNISIAMHRMDKMVYGTLTGPGDLSNTKVSLYTSLSAWMANIPDQYVMSTGTGTSVPYVFNTVNPGTYYMDVWKDTDNSGTWTFGDYIGWYGTGSLGNVQLTPLVVAQNTSVEINLTLIVRQ